VDAEMVRRRALAVEDVDSAPLAKVVLGPTGVPLVERQQLRAFDDIETCLRDFRHHRVLLHAQRAVARGELDDLRHHVEFDAAAMAGAKMMNFQYISSALRSPLLLACQRSLEHLQKSIRYNEGEGSTHQPLRLGGPPRCRMRRRATRAGCRDAWSR